MEERDICCCGARGWNLVIGWLQIIIGISALLALGDLCLLLHHYRNMFMAIEMIWLCFAIVSIYMVYVLIRGCKNKDPELLSFWRIYAGISLVILTNVFFANLLVIPAEEASWSIFILGIEMANQAFCIWVIGIHESEIEASSGIAVA